MDELEQSMARESARQNAEEGITTTTTETAVTTETNTTAASEAAPSTTNETTGTGADASATVVDQNKAGEAAPVTTETSNDWLANLERISGGSIKTQDDLLAALEKAKEVDTLKPTLAELQAKLAVNPFADDYMQRLNELKKGGATKEQLIAFGKVNDLGDLSELSSREAKIMKMVLVDGIGEQVARRKVDKQFDMEGLEGDDLEDVQSDLDQSARKDRKELEAFKAEASVVPVSDKPLMDAAAKAKFESELNPVLNDFTQKYSSFATLNLNGKEGEQAVTLDLKVSDDDKAGMVADIREFMVENNLPLTQENYNDALSYARAKVITSNLDKITQEVWQKADAHFTKLYTEKYENTGGKPKGDQAPTQKDTDDEQAHKAWKKDMLTM